MAPILPNTLYLTFNVPAIDEYHRGLLLTYPKPRNIIGKVFRQIPGCLFHAKWDDSSSTWEIEKKVTKNINRTRSLCLMFRLHTFDSTMSSAKLFDDMQRVLDKVPMGKEERERVMGEVKMGNPRLGGYNCITWVTDGMHALQAEGLIGLQGKDVEELMKFARSLAGPEDGKTMAGKKLPRLVIN